MYIFIDDPALKLANPVESNLKYRVTTEFYLTYNKLYKNSDSRFQEPRYIVPESEAFDIIINIYLQLLYTGRDKV
jgi:CMP-N-acetylneuraminic acid synthetase